MPYIKPVHTIIETPAYLAAAAAAEVSADEAKMIVDFFASNPAAGNPIQGTGGCRKVRFATRGRGKSGGYRVITFYSGADIPVFLLTVFAKADRADLSAAERNQLRGLTKRLVEAYRRSRQPGDEARARPRRPRT